MALERFGPGTTPEEWRYYGHLHLQRYRFTMPYVGGKRVLDLACGVGYGSYSLRTLGAKEVLGVDLSEEAIAYARQTYVRSELYYEAGDALTWKSTTGAFDVVTSFETIEHLPDPEKFVQQVATHLPAGGTLIISAPNRLQYQGANPPRENQFHLNEPDYATLRDWLTPHFEIEGEWEQSPVTDGHGASAQRSFMELEQIFSYRVVRKVEKILRRIFASSSSKKTSSPSLLDIVTDIQPLLPERRSTCDVFVFVCRRKP